MEKTNNNDNVNNKEASANVVEGRNVVLETMRAGKEIDRLLIQEGLRDNTIAAIIKLAKQKGVVFDYVKKERLNSISESGNHQGVIAYVAAYDYVSVDDILNRLRKRAKRPL